MEEANPVLLEPVGHLEVIVPSEYMGDVIGDINKRRGRVLNMEPLDKKLQKVTAEVPISEVHKYATDLRFNDPGARLLYTGICKIRGSTAADSTENNRRKQNNLLRPGRCCNICPAS